VLYPPGSKRARVSVPPTHNTAIALNAIELFHAVARVGGPEAPAPPAQIGHQLVSAGGESWQLRSGERIVHSYNESELRFSLQWKAECFVDSQEVEGVDSGRDSITVDQAVEVLKVDLRERGVLGDKELDPTDLALLMIEHYIDFPAGDPCIAS